MKTHYHKSMTVEKWSEYGFAKQILMIGSEFARAKSLIQKRKFDHVKECYARAMELVDLTIYDPKWNTLTKLRELLRFREMMGILYTEKFDDLQECNLYYKVLLSWNGETAKVEI
ncbi:MAG: hypothetical protein H7A23_23700 [Leptospiraceae bacterium]|nr:hypothetical protein [Leptospiraceae bacterium]MCP5497569.1 hypothetical protein [Leptospiraceae bacterium]